MRAATLTCASAVAVLVAARAARHLPGPMAGMVAASPITPTVAVLSLGSEASPLVLLDGIPTVIAALAALCVFAVAPRTRPRLWFGACIAVLLVLPFILASLPLAFSGILGAGLLVVATILHRRPAGPPAATRRPLPSWVLLAVGAAAVPLVALSMQVAPSLVSLASMAPLVFLASWTGAFLDGGWSSAARVARGAVSGCVGILAFALAHAALDSLAIAWAVFALSTLTWHLVLSHSPPLRTRTRYSKPTH